MFPLSERSTKISTSGKINEISEDVKVTVFHRKQFKKSLSHHLDRITLRMVRVEGYEEDQKFQTGVLGMEYKP